VPVGPAASVVMAEAILIDVDQFVRELGVTHTRYVDDFRIFGDTVEQLYRIQQDLTLYLYETHRLIMNGAKTFIESSEKFVEKKLHNPHVEETTKLFKSIEVFNPYTEDVHEILLEIEDEGEIVKIRVTKIIERILSENLLISG